VVDLARGPFGGLRARLLDSNTPRTDVKRYGSAAVCTISAVPGRTTARRSPTATSAGTL
jgi:hypothetical protein